LEICIVHAAVKLNSCVDLTTAEYSAIKRELEDTFKSTPGIIGLETCDLMNTMLPAALEQFEKTDVEGLNKS